MYSYEERIRAVKLYLKLGKRLTATVRQLGYQPRHWMQRLDATRPLEENEGRRNAGLVPTAVGPEAMPIHDIQSCNFRCIHLTIRRRTNHLR
ncbi:hypothetical protein CFB39_09405 [Burkholderia sp. AU6039]|nr:hypothetical protein CFB39_09405 [Burkholderia sp. AU6039]